MPMVGDAMGEAIMSKIQAIPGINITSTSELQSFCNAVGEAIVTYIQSNALVTTSDIVTIPITNTPGLPSAGTGVGTGTVS